MPRKKGHEAHSGRLDLQLFVAGSGVRSLRTIDSVKRACEKHAPGQYHLSIVDIYLQPEAAAAAQVVALPTLVRTYPAPKKMYVGEIKLPADLDRRFSWLAAAGESSS